MEKVIPTRVVGVSRRQEWVRKLTENTPLRLRREPDNPADPNAVAVDAYIQGQWRHIGYLERRLAEELASELDAGTPVQIRISGLTGGTKEKPTRGVNVHIIVPLQEEEETIPQAQSTPSQAPSPEHQSAASVAAPKKSRRWFWLGLGALFFFCACCTVLGVIGSAQESSQTTPTAAAEVETPQQAQAPKPAFTTTPLPPTATTTPRPTATRTPTPSPSPTPTVTPTPIVIEGRGSDVIDLPGAPYDMPILIYIEGNKSSRYFGVTAYDANGEMIDLLVNTTEPYKGTRLVLDLTITTLEIEATGSWRIEVKDFLSYVPIIGCNDSYSGTGDDVFIVKCKKPIDKVHIVGNKKARYFGVTVYSIGSPGDYDLLVNTTEPFDGRKLLRGFAPPLIFEVIAADEWTITMEP